MTEQWKPNVTVAALVERQNRFLMVEELRDGRRVLNQPAGHLEKGETLLEAVRREVREETGRDFSPQALVGVYVCPKPRSSITYLRFCFHGTVSERDPESSLDEGILDALWLTREQISAYSERLRSPMVEHCLRDHLAGQRFPLELIRHWRPSTSK